MVVLFLIHSVMKAVDVQNDIHVMTAIHLPVEVEFVFQMFQILRAVYLLLVWEVYFDELFAVVVRVKIS